MGSVANERLSCREVTGVWFLIPGLILGKLFKLSAPQFLHFKNGNNKEYLPHRVVLKIKQEILKKITRHITQ